MNSIAALIKAQDEIVAILANAGLSDGDAGAAGDVQYWELAVKLKQASDKQIYAVWNVLSISQVSSADDRPRGQEVIVAVDFFTRRPMTSSLVRDIIISIQNKAAAAGWRLEFGGPAQYDFDTNLNHMLFNMTKTLTK
jgi:hypothetical protein